MIKKVMIVGVAALMVLALAAVAAAELVKAGEKNQAPPTRVLLKKTEPRSIASMRHTGPYEDIPEVVMNLVGQLAMEGYAMTGPLMVVYYNSDQEVPDEELMWEVWMPVAYPGPMKMAGEDTLGFRHVDPIFVAYTFHLGSYETLSEAYDVLLDWAETNEYKISGPPIEVYWNDPMTVPEERLVTEIWFPVEEKRIPGVAR